MDKKNRAVEKDIQPGDKVMCTQKRTNTKTPWDPNPYVVKEVKGSQLVVERGPRKLKRAKNYVKKLKPRPEYLQIQDQYQGDQYEEEAEVSNCYMARTVRGYGEGIQGQGFEAIQEVQEPEFAQEVQEVEAIRVQEEQEAQEQQDF